jgi:putative transposase
VGYGGVYQGRYKSFPLQDDAHFTTVVRYVERNPLRAKLVGRAQAWRWSSLGQKAGDGMPLIPLARWPVARRRDWVEWTNKPQTSAEEAAVLHCLTHSRPYGGEGWTGKMESRLEIPPLRKRGRPRKQGG